MASLAPAPQGARAGCLGRGHRAPGGVWRQVPLAAAAGVVAPQAAPPASAGGHASSSAPGRARLACLAPAAAACASGGAGCAGRRRRRGLAVVARAVDEDLETPVVELTSATVRRGQSLVLDEVELKVPRGARAVIVGPNGCGKTTLLSTIAGGEPVEGGTLDVSAESVGWLRQEAVGGSRRTVLNEAIAEMPAAAFMEQMRAAEARFEAAAGGTPEEVAAAQEAYDEALGKFVASGGDSMQRRAEEVLSGLGFVKQDFGRPCSELSGGWQMRVALARALLREPALLLLDEPTNHMDSAAKRWLASHLAGGLSRDVTMLLVTHDRSLLQDIRCTHVIEIAEKRIIPYVCSGILEWERIRANRVKYLYNEMDKLQKQIDKAQAWVNRFGAKATLASRANSMKKEIQWNKDKYAQFLAETRGLPSADVVLGKGNKAKVDDEAATDGTLPLSGPSTVNLKLPDPPLMMEPPVDGVLVSIKKADVGYEGSTPIVSNVNINISVKTCLAILGPNGTGKTTLLRTLAGTMPAQTGERRVGAGGLRKAKLKLFTQDLAQDLPLDTTPIDYVLDGAPMSLSEQDARKALGSLGLRPEVHKSQIGTLSGGEKARVALAVFTTRPSDVLLLDEPTNHLDGAAVTALCRGLVEHARKGGAIVVASHDKAFVQALQVTDVASVSRGGAGEAGSVRVDAGPLPDAFSPSSAPSPLAAVATGGANSANVAEAAAEEVLLPRLEKQAAPKAAVDATSAAKAFKAKVATIEAEELMESIEKQETELEEAQQAMHERWTEEKYETVQRLEAELEAAYARWEKLAATIQAATS